MRVEIRHVEAGSDLRRGRRAELLQAELARGPRRAAARAVPPRDAQSSRPAGPGARPRRRDEDTFLYLLVSNSAPIVRAQDKGARIFGPPTLPWLFWRGGAWSGVPGVGARCGNGLFSTYKSPKILS